MDCLGSTFCWVAWVLGEHGDLKCYISNYIGGVRHTLSSAGKSSIFVRRQLPTTLSIWLGMGLGPEGDQESSNATRVFVGGVPRDTCTQSVVAEASEIPGIWRPLEIVACFKKRHRRVASDTSRQRPLESPPSCLVLHSLRDSNILNKLGWLARWNKTVKTHGGNMYVRRTAPLSLSSRLSRCFVVRAGRLPALTAQAQGGDPKFTRREDLAGRCARPRRAREK